MTAVRQDGGLWPLEKGRHTSKKDRHRDLPLRTNQTTIALP